MEPIGDGVLSTVNLVPSGQPQLMLINVEGRQERNHYTKSLFNQKEIKTVHILFRNYLHDYKYEIMIICLYKEQQRRLRQEIGNEYTILTVDSAQGKEKPIVILMTTRTQEDFREGSFFKSVERCNVAISRQKKALIILGKVSLLDKVQPWSTVVKGTDFHRYQIE